MNNIEEIQQQLENIDEHLLRLLEDRVKICRDANVASDADLTAEVVAFWIEEAADRGIDEVLAEKLAKVITAMGKKIEE